MQSSPRVVEGELGPCLFPGNYRIIIGRKVIEQGKITLNFFLQVGLEQRVDDRGGGRPAQLRLPPAAAAARRSAEADAGGSGGSGQANATGERQGIVQHR